MEKAEGRGAAARLPTRNLAVASVTSSRQHARHSARVHLCSIAAAAGPHRVCRENSSGYGLRTYRALETKLTDTTLPPHPLAHQPPPHRRFPQGTSVRARSCLQRRGASGCRPRMHQGALPPACASRAVRRVNSRLTPLSHLPLETPASPPSNQWLLCALHTPSAPPPHTSFRKALTAKMSDSKLRLAAGTLAASCAIFFALASAHSACATCRHNAHTFLSIASTGL